MKVVINDECYDANDCPVLLILSDQDKENIHNMMDSSTCYLAYPDSMSEKKAKEILSKWRKNEGRKKPKD